MRLWSLHPRYLDSKGLVALWREGLLAKTYSKERRKAIETTRSWSVLKEFFAIKDHKRVPV